MGATKSTVIPLYYHEYFSLTKVNFWTQIKNTTHDDEGVYECCVITDTNSDCRNTSVSIIGEFKFIVFLISLKFKPQKNNLYLKKQQIILI